MRSFLFFQNSTFSLITVCNCTLLYLFGWKKPFVISVKSLALVVLLALVAHVSHRVSLLSSLISHIVHMVLPQLLLCCCINMQGYVLCRLAVL